MTVMRAGFAFLAFAAFVGCAGSSSESQGECTTATEATDCGPHEFCDGAGAASTCRCVAAYVDSGSGCVFAGAPLDPGIADPASWITVGPGVSVEPAAAGNVDAGEVVFDREGVCEYSFVVQTVTMPPFDRAEPLRVRVTHIANDPDFALGGTLVSIGVGDQFVDLPMSRNIYRTDTFCLGPAGYGGPLEFRIGTLAGSTFLCSPSSTSTATIAVDQLAVEVADPGQCPSPSTVVNGNFEAAGGWTFQSVSNGTGTVLPGVGEGGTDGAQLSQPNMCSEVTMEGTIALPAAGTLPNPAIDLYWSGTNGGRLIAQIGGKDVATLSANGTARHQRICIPSWAAGNTATIAFFTPRVSGNQCTTALNRTYVIDNVTIVNEPLCLAAGLTDPGFERIANSTGPVPGWGIHDYYVNDLLAASTAVLNSAGSARTGNGVLRVSASNECGMVGRAGADVSFVVPPAQGTSGPAIRWFANVGPATKTVTRVMLMPLSARQVTIPPSGGYTPGTLCLPPTLIGRRVTARFSLGDVDGGGCATSYPTETAFFDDVEVGTDPICPAL